MPDFITGQISESKDFEFKAKGILRRNFRLYNYII